jgi:hypothetical protein
LRSMASIGAAPLHISICPVEACAPSADRGFGVQSLRNPPGQNLPNGRLVARDFVIECLRRQRRPAESWIRDSRGRGCNLALRPRASATAAPARAQPRGRRQPEGASAGEAHAPARSGLRGSDSRAFARQGNPPSSRRGRTAGRRAHRAVASGPAAPGLE